MTEKTPRTGLTDVEAKARLEKYGRNELGSGRKDNFLLKVLHIAGEPMFMLLIAASVIYFILGEPRDGAVMLIFVVGIIGIDVIQEWKTDKTLAALKDLSAPRIAVIRDGTETEIAGSEIVPGDLMVIYEGVKIPADGVIVRCSDLRVDESTLTGEAEGVWKSAFDGVQKQEDRNCRCYAGTLVTQGTAVVQVEKTGALTEYGKIGVAIAEAEKEKTPLQKQTGGIVKVCAVIAAVLLVLVGIATFINLRGVSFGDRVISSVLSGITLAMAMIPEEFPVILTVFLSMGAWRLARKKSLVRRLPSVETLGSVSVLCVDKTGTITLNRMTVQETWAPDGDTQMLCETMGLACETEAYDPMEKAMLAYCGKIGIPKEHLFGGRLVREYAFTDELKMMGHVWLHDGQIIIAAKGSPEKLLTICAMTPEERAEAEKTAARISGQGMRVIAVGMAEMRDEADVPSELTACTLKFCGLIGLADPPRPSVKDDIAVCYQAGIRVVMITGDSGITASAIAEKVGISNSGKAVTGSNIDEMSDGELLETVKTVNIYSRVTPEHKMRIVRALKENGEIVAMTGDGVNDAPALKYADIGIAMGQRGSEVSREAADLILMDDNFSTIVDTIRDGRRIYDNIRKAMGYVFTIHIPIAFSSLLAPMLGIAPANLLILPLHVVLLELIIDPTCSVVLERQPGERDIMHRSPRKPEEKLLPAKAILKSVLQGIVVLAVSFGTYFFMLKKNPDGASTARSMGILIIMLANLFLVVVNSSESDSAFESLKRLGGDKVMWFALAGTAAMAAVILYTPLNAFLKLSPLTAGEFALSAGFAALSVLWYEIVKLIMRMRVKA